MDGLLSELEPEKRASSLCSESFVEALAFIFGSITFSSLLPQGRISPLPSQICDLFSLAEGRIPFKGVQFALSVASIDRSFCLC